MPACTLGREVDGSTAIFRISGRFDGACAWDLASRLERDALSELVVDFSQVDQFVDYGIAVLASAIMSLPQKRIRLQDLRQHQERLFRYFGVDPQAARQRASPSLPLESLAAVAAKEVA
jgi:anti-anti-sigma regulatory factor